MVSKTYPKVGANSTLDSKARSTQDKTLTAKQGLKNVNVAQGPRTGNMGSTSKRADFMADKRSAAPLAAYIEDAYKARGDYRKEKFAPGEGAISQDNAPRSRKR